MNYKTEVHLFNNVPFSQNYQHSRSFKNISEQQQYFRSLEAKVSYTESRYVKIFEGQMIVETEINYMDRFNYLSITNKVDAKTDKTYYCFITKIERRSSSSLLINFEIDVFQTFMFDYSFQQSFIERGHTRRYNANGRPVINTALESVNLGSEYNTISTNVFQSDIDKYFNTMVVIAATRLDDTIQKSSKHVVSGIATPLTFYTLLIPKEGTRTSAYTIKFNGTNLYESFGLGSPTVSDILRIFDAFYDEGLANRIVGISYLPFFPFTSSVTRSTGVNQFIYNITVDSNDFTIESLLGDDLYKVPVVADSQAKDLKNIITDNIYDKLKSYFNSNGIRESKLMMHPFSKATLYDGLGNTFEIKPQYTKDGAINIDGLVSISSSPKSALITKGYLNRGDYNNAIIGNLNADVEIVNDHTATYIQGNKNSDKAKMDQIKGSSAIQRFSGAMTMGVGIATANPMATIAGGAMVVGGRTDAFFNTRDLLASREDIENVPPSIVGQAGAGSLGLGFNLIQPRLEISTLSLEYLRIIDDYFHMYGTSQNKLMDIPYQTRKYFNFIKTVGCNIKTSIPAVYSDKLKSIYDDGITVWHTSDMMNYNVNNEEV